MCVSRLDYAAASGEISRNDGRTSAAWFYEESALSASVYGCFYLSVSVSKVCVSVCVRLCVAEAKPRFACF